MDYARARHLMVESQIRPNDVTDQALIAAFRQIPREAFTPAHLKSVAYSDQELDLGAGRYLLRPRDLGKLLQGLAPRPGQKALEIAGATGYGSALMAACGADVTLLEPDQGLLNAALTAFKEVGLTDARSGATAIAAGWADGAPYDIILVNGAVEVTPEAWFAQLAENGKLAVIVRAGASGGARLYSKAHGTTAYRVLFDAAPPVLPGLVAPRPFHF
jgi:protein-L-isoaspartate(D-aspartate) O-methyltransferase